MGNYRIDRINEQFTNEMAIILRNIKDPRIARNFISVTHCSVTPDLKYAKIYYSVMEQGKPIDHKAIKQGLYSAAGFIRHTVAETLNMRATPEFTFEYDDAIKRGANIFELLKQTGVTSDTEKEEQGDDEQ